MANLQVMDERRLLATPQPQQYQKQYRKQLMILHETHAPTKVGGEQTTKSVSTAAASQ